MLTLRILGLIVLCAGFVSCESTHKVAKTSSVYGKRINGVRTTAYTHTESDHVKYGPKAATGDTLRYGSVRSAAADWSVYPVGTLFQIDGEPFLYEVDDYGSALVGTGTIDLYKPSRAAMNEYGAKNVNIKVVKWGSYSKSLEIMKPRTKYAHIQQMVKKIETSS